MATIDLRASLGRRLLPFALALAAAGCGGEYRERPDEMGEDSAPESATLAEEAPPVLAEDSLPAVGVPRPAPTQAGAPSDTAASVPMAGVVRGQAEIRLKGGRLVPAEYFLVTLESGDRRFRTVVDRSGEFFFDSVPAGRYSLAIYTQKGQLLARSTATITADTVVVLDHLHVSADRIRTPRQELR